NRPAPVSSRDVDHRRGRSESTKGSHPFEFDARPDQRSSKDRPSLRDLLIRVGEPAGRALHKKSWAVIDGLYSLGCATVGARYERPRCIFCAKPAGSKEATQVAYRTDPACAAANASPEGGS